MLRISLNKYASLYNIEQCYGLQACRWQAPHRKKRLSLTVPIIHGSSPLSVSRTSDEAPGMQAVSARYMADVMSAMLDSSQCELLERFCSRAGERALKRLCAPPDSSTAFSGWSKKQNEQLFEPYVTSIAMHVVGEGRSRGLLMYAGCSDGRINSMHFHFGDTVRYCI